MTPQDFKALLDALRGIQQAIEGKAGSSPEKAVNRFAEVYRMLQDLDDWVGDLVNIEDLKVRILEIKKTYAKIAEEVLNEEN